MKNLQENIIRLRKEKSLTQKELGEKLGVSFQTISKWENGVTLPDITLLPDLANIFEVSIDQLMGRKAIMDRSYQKRNKDSIAYRNQILSQFIASRNLYWNDDYLKHLIDHVWKITSPVKVAEVAAGNGCFGHQLLKHLPKGSLYVGFEKSTFLRENGNVTPQEGFTLKDFSATNHHQGDFDMVICQGYLRHVENPMKGIEILHSLAKTGGLIIAHEENRPFENVGLLLGDLEDRSFEKSLYLDKLWSQEASKEERDYRIGLRLPLLFKAANLHNIDCRMNDRVNTILSSDDQTLLDTINEHYRLTSIKETDFPLFLMERGLAKHEAKRYIELYHERKNYMHQRAEAINLVHVIGLMITWAYK